MKRQLIFAFSMLMLTACGTDEVTVQQPPEGSVQIDVVEKEVNGQTEEVGTTTEENVKEADKSISDITVEKTFQSIIPSDWNIKLPSEFPVTKGKYLTAITSLEQQKEVTFNFYETDREFAMNDSKIKETGHFVGQLIITKYSTSELASKEIDQTVFSNGEVVDLGHGIKGYQDAGAGSLFTSWNEGRWAIISRSTTENSEESLANAKETVEFLETHMMPIPKQYGQLHIDAEDSGSMAKWQKHNYVYTITDFGDKTLEWLVSFE